MATDKDTRISAWSRADALDGCPSFEMFVVGPDSGGSRDHARLNWKGPHPDQVAQREEYARMAVAAVDAYLADYSRRLDRYSDAVERGEVGK